MDVRVMLEMWKKYIDQKVGTFDVESYKRNELVGQNCRFLSRFDTNSLVFYETTYFVGVQMEASCRDSESKELRSETRQLSVVGAVRVAIQFDVERFKELEKK
ncbi:unnamed protein product [Eruca vesicaria subsp. sativa]|uniref:Uncharacterized protein n=1 Tax=Eruca vesicaria subsp. sativa TaxID=29727 RepID=A0ABC8JLT8_ERUVS|nr:unnamed protein product [Eruca vesicaria subsp. sativa]